MYCIKVKRRGFNYYTDYMERYFEKVAVSYDFHLVKRREQAEMWCLTFVGEPNTDVKWITFAADVFNRITHERLNELSSLIAECFKSTSVIEPIDNELEEIIQQIIAYLKGEHDFPMSQEQCLKYGFPHIWLFSRKYSAFDEPPFITDGETVLSIISHNAFYISGENFSVEVQNFGGVSKGLIINISFSNALPEKPIIEEPRFIIPRKHDCIYTPLELERLEDSGRTIFHVELPDYSIPEGVNIHSAQLCGRKKHVETDLRTFDVIFVPIGNEELLRSMEIEVIPIEYPINKAVLKACDLK